MEDTKPKIEKVVLGEGARLATEARRLAKIEQEKKMLKAKEKRMEKKGKKTSLRSVAMEDTKPKIEKVVLGDDSSQDKAGVVAALGVMATVAGIFLVGQSRWQIRNLKLKK